MAQFGQYLNDEWQPARVQQPSNRSGRSLPHQLDTGMIEPEQEMQDGKARS